jgi:glucan phosphorylase
MKTINPPSETTKPGVPESPLARFNCGQMKFSGGDNAPYERHLTFDQVISPSEVTPRASFEAIARSVRDVLSQRWLQTEQTYRSRNAKRVYYLSLEFLGVFAPILDTLLRDGDHYLHLADLKSYSDAHERLGQLYADQEEWSRKAILNIAASGKFSSDRTIAEYVSDIWQAEACPIEPEVKI